MAQPPSKRAKKEMEVVTCTAPVNIAVIKYWGKRNSELLLPTNSSLSATLHQDQLHAKTTVARSPSFTSDRIWLNKIEENIKTKRLQNCLNEIKARARKAGTLTDKNDWPVHICSENNFPTAAGLASSAAGYACLASALANLYGVSDTELSSIARVGSGSACRSVYGGWVKWNMGTKDDGSDSLAEQIADENHWPEIQILVLVVNANKKEVSSSAGMQTSVKTSSLMQERIKSIVPKRMAEMEKAILEKDFETFGRTTIQDSNQFHAVCLDTYPPIFYMNDTSKFIVNILSKYNEYHGEVKAAYTFDAGPNCCIYCRKDDVPSILALVEEYLPWSKPKDGAHPFYRGLTSAAPSENVPEELKEQISATPRIDGVKYVLHTEPGPGPRVLGRDAALVNDSGLPK